MCGVTSSKNNKKPTPTKKPTAAGTKENFPREDDCSRAGTNKLQKDAATMTPAANPVNPFCSFSLILSFNTNTIAAPKDVPINGINIPIVVLNNI